MWSLTYGTKFQGPTLFSFNLDVDECASNPCLNGACTDGINRYDCTCNSGWAGTNCDIGK